MTTAPARAPGRPAEAYAGLSERAREWISQRQSSVARACGVTPVTACDWARGRKQPTYDHARALLERADMALEDFGYTELPNGQVARLLAPGHAPAPVAFVRASGDCRCETCGRPYWKHTELFVPGTDMLVLHVLCDNRRVKL